MKKRISGFWCAAALMLSACSHKGEEFVGQWEAKAHKNRSAVIERNGDNFLIKYTEPSIFSRGKTDTDTMPAVYKDGTLEVAGSFGTSKVGYVKSTDTLLMPMLSGSMEFRRVRQ